MKQMIQHTDGVWTEVDVAPQSGTIHLHQCYISGKSELAIMATRGATINFNGALVGENYWLGRLPRYKGKSIVPSVPMPKNII